MRALLLKICLAFAVSGAASGVAADSHVSARLATAVQAWLNEDDQTALPALTALSAEGDQAAILLLGRIAVLPKESWTPWVAGLSRSEREEFFNPGGFDILAVRALSGDPVAEAFLAAAKSDAGVDVARTLFENGEAEASRSVIWRAMENGKVAEVLEMPADDPTRKNLDFLFWLQGWVAAGHKSAEPEKWVASGPEAGRASGLILASWLTQFVAADKPLPANLKRVAAALDGATATVKDPEERTYLEKQLERLGRRDAALIPAASMCKRLCPTEVGACMVDSLRRLGGYDAAMHLDTPLESVIPQLSYARSPRAEGVFERMVRAAKGGGDADSACLAAAIDG